LTAAQIAFAHRIALHRDTPQLLPQSLLAAVLNYPSPSASDTQPPFQDLVRLGSSLLNYFTREYLKTRFPNLHAAGLELGLRAFTGPGNLALLARFLGIEAAVAKDSAGEREEAVSRGRSIKTPRWARNSVRRDDAAVAAAVAAAEDGRRALVAKHADAFKALLGAMAVGFGPQECRLFLDSRHFTSVFPVDRLCSPEYPVPELTEHLRRVHRDASLELEFRLHQESGRLSNSAMFVVGVYGPDMEGAVSHKARLLGEGFGASIALAQQRAATSALRIHFLKETEVRARPSDSFRLLTDFPEGTIDLPKARAQ
jgi:dsRNA-specific ribonuclease